MFHFTFMVNHNFNSPEEEDSVFDLFEDGEEYEYDEDAGCFCWYDEEHDAWYWLDEESGEWLLVEEDEEECYDEEEEYDEEQA